MSEFANENPEEFAGTGVGLIMPCWRCGKFVQFAHHGEHWKTFNKRGPTCDACWEKVQEETAKHEEDQEQEPEATGDPRTEAP